MRIGMISPVAWRTPPRHYGPWEQVTSLITEGLVKHGHDVTLFATQDSVTSGRLHATVPVGYEEDLTVNRRVAECLHISEVFEHAGEFDLIHNNFDFLPLAYARLVKTPLLTTIHGFSSPSIVPVYKKYDSVSHYVSISNADRHPDLTYSATVYHGIDPAQFSFSAEPGAYLLFFGRIHNDKGTHEALQIARRAGLKLIIAGIIQDQAYFAEKVEPYIDGTAVEFVGSADPVARNKLMSGALALLHPIQFNEPFGLTMIEAAACGTPVIAFRRGSMPELIVDGVTGFLVTSVDEAAAAVPKVRDLDRQAARRHVEERFTVERMIEGYIQVYQQIVG
jgi:glycosyltransferase involved in cell wall biosynthesis